ncbi:MAG: non-canonical purine NTP pyrophosphatase, partial [Amphiplicatus sp.]
MAVFPERHGPRPCRSFLSFVSLGCLVVSLFLRRLIRRLVEYRYTLIEKRCKRFSSKNDNFFSKHDMEPVVTARKLAPGKLVIASHNAGKVREINDLMKSHQIVAISAGALRLAEPEETETTFSGNAALKARAAASASDLPALADDSGLEVAALGGAPGVYSARWAGAAKDFGAAMERVRQALEQGDATDP